jgi:hypothetical protein
MNTYAILHFQSTFRINTYAKLAGGGGSAANVMAIRSVAALTRWGVGASRRLLEFQAEAGSLDGQTATSRPYAILASWIDS